MLELKKINRKNVADILKLEVFDNQKSFVAINNINIIRRYVTFIESEYVKILGIFREDKIVGFLW